MPVSLQKTPNYSVKARAEALMRKRLENNDLQTLAVVLWLKPEMRRRIVGPFTPPF